MAALVTLQAAKDHLRLSMPLGDPDEPDLQAKLDAADALVRDYVAQRRCDPDGTWAATVASWDVTATPPVPPPPHVLNATLIVLGDLWRYRGDDLANEAPPRELGELPRAAMALLYRLRDPAVA